jgi:hypothetical protein
MSFELCPLPSIAWSELPAADADAIAPGLRGGEDDVLPAASSSCELMPGTDDKAKPNTLHRTAQPVPGAYMTAPSGRASTITVMRRALAALLVLPPAQLAFPGPIVQTDE